MSNTEPYTLKGHEIGEAQIGQTIRITTHHFGELVGLRILEGERAAYVRPPGATVWSIWVIDLGREYTLYPPAPKVEAVKATDLTRAHLTRRAIRVFPLGLGEAQEIGLSDGVALCGYDTRTSEVLLRFARDDDWDTTNVNCAPDGVVELIVEES